MVIKRCNSPHPYLKYDNGKKVKCSLLKFHQGKHFDSFAMRKWKQ